MSRYSKYLLGIPTPSSLSEQVGIIYNMWPEPRCKWAEVYSIHVTPLPLNIHNVRKPVFG